jgi:hypothetical protein
VNLKNRIHKTKKKKEYHIDENVVVFGLDIQRQMGVVVDKYLYYFSLYYMAHYYGGYTLHVVVEIDRQDLVDFDERVARA